MSKGKYNGQTLLAGCQEKQATNPSGACTVEKKHLTNQIKQSIFCKFVK